MFFGVFSAQIIIKQGCQTFWRRWRRRPEYIFGTACLSPHTAWIDRKTAGLFFLAESSALFYFLCYLFCADSLAGTGRTELCLCLKTEGEKKIQKTHIVCMVIHMGICFVFCMYRVGKRIWVRHELHSQCGHQRASGRCGRSQASGDERLPSEG